MAHRNGSAPHPAPGTTQIVKDIACRYLPVLAWAALIYLLSALPRPYPQLGAGLPPATVLPGSSLWANITLVCNFSGGIDISGAEAHLTGFAVLSMLLMRALVWRGQPNAWHVAAVFTLSALYAASDELHQMFVPGRGCELVDFWMDLVGAGLGIFLYLMIRRLKRPPPETPVSGADHLP